MRASGSSLFVAIALLAALGVASAQNPPPTDGSSSLPPPVNTGASTPATTPNAPASPNPHDSLIGNAPPDRSAVAEKAADDRKMQRCMSQQKAANSSATPQQMKQKCQAQIAAEQAH